MLAQVSTDIVSVNFSSVQFSAGTESKHVKSIMEHMAKILKVLYSYYNSVCMMIKLYIL